MFAFCCKQQQRKTSRVQQFTSSLVIPFAHGKLNVKNHRTTPIPSIYTSITAEKSKLRSPENSTEHHNVHRRRSSSCARPISTNPTSMEEECEYGLPSGCFLARRLEVIAVAGLLIYFVKCFLTCLLGFRFFFVFFASNAHGPQQVRGNLALCTCLPVPGCVQGAII